MNQILVMRWLKKASKNYLDKMKYTDESKILELENDEQARMPEFSDQISLPVPSEFRSKNFPEFADPKKRP